MASASAVPFAFSQVPDSPSFRNSAVNTVALVPLLSSDKDGEIATTRSAQSFTGLLDALHRHAGIERKDSSDRNLLLVVPNNSLTRPGDWRYNETPLKAFHWQHGCQRMQIVDGRPQHSRAAHDRLMNHAITRDWIDLCPSRRTAAVIGVLNMHDCKDLSDLHRAEEELHQWAERYATPPYEVTAHGRNFDRDKPVERLFVFDSFDEDCQKIDLSQSKMGNTILAFPPSDEAHSQMMDLHLNVVVNDLAVAIFRRLEKKVQEADDITKGAVIQSTQSNARRSLTRIISGASEKDSEEPSQAASGLSLSNIAGLVSPDSKLAKDSPPNKKDSKKDTFTFSSDVVESSKTATSSLKVTPKPSSAPQLLTPMDENYEQAELSLRDAEAIRKRDVGRREKYAADLSLMAGSPLDAYERYLKAAELCKTGSPDPLWYASALEGCAAAHIAMAEAGGYNVDKYLENNFQLPDEIMALAKREPKDEKRQTQAYAVRQTLPEVVIALCEEALNILDRHPRLAPFHAELLLKLAQYCSESAEGHLRCRWGEGEGSYGGDVGETPRWEMPSVSQLKFQDLKTKENGDMIAINTLNRIKKICELLQAAVSVGPLDAATRVDVAARSARMCLDGVKATQWKETDLDRIKLPRKAALFTVVAAEALSESRSSSSAAEDLWLLASQLYSSDANPGEGGGSYGWATLRASTLHALSLQGTSLASHEAAEVLLSLLGEILPESLEDVASINAQRTLKANEQEGASGPDQSQSPGRGVRRASLGFGDDESEQEAQLVSNTIASKIRHSFTSMTAASSLLAVQSKWADDDVVQPVDVPLSGLSGISASVLSLNCVWSSVDGDKCSAAQKRCMDRIVALRRALPAPSASAAKLSSIYSANGGKLPLYISSVMPIDAESTLELECVKKRNSPKKEDQGAMATFFNPYANKKEAGGKGDITRVAEEEERALLIQFGNRLSVPLEVKRCQLQFESSANGRVKATALSFILPPKSSDFTVHFPFTILSRPTSTDDADVSNELFEVKGINLTLMGRSFFVSISSLKEGATNSVSSNSIPEPVSTYPHTAAGGRNSETEKADTPRFEAYPCQPRLHVFFANSGAPIQADAAVPVRLTDGEIVTTSSFRLENYCGPSGRGKMERLQVLAIGLPGKMDSVLYDSKSSDKKELETKVFAEDLIHNENPPPFKIQALVSSLELDSINDKKEDGSKIRLQIAAAHNLGSTVSKETTVYIRFRYRGPSNVTTEVWRRREIALRIVYFKGPRISSIACRPDLAKGSLYEELSRSLQARSPIRKAEEKKDNSEVTSLDLKRIGLDTGIHVCSDEVVFVLTVSNETNSDIILSKPNGAVGGFEGNPLSTVQVHSNVSAKIPIVMPRVPRINEDGSSVDIVKEFVSRTTLQWKSIVNEKSDEEPVEGVIRIPAACLEEIIHRNPLFVSRLCQPPCQIELSVDARAASKSPIVIPPGSPVDITVHIEVASWVPPEAVDKCSVKLEFFCARQDEPSRDSDHADYIWCGKLRRTFDMKDSDKSHSIKIVFCAAGRFGLSACARISQETEEIWFAPKAETVIVDKQLLQSP